MSIWRWLFGPVDRFFLYLEAKGWIFYRNKKPSSSPASMWIGLHQALEPGVKHIHELGQERREESEEDRKERLLSHLLACLDANGANIIEEIRFYLTAAKEAGWDWKGLYEEAVRMQTAVQPNQADSIPSISDVAPLE